MHSDEKTRSEPLHRERLIDASKIGGNKTPASVPPQFAAGSEAWGATVSGGSVRYRTWAPEQESLAVEVQPAAGPARTVKMTRDENGFHSATDPEGKAGDHYLYRFPSGAFPDPASRAQAGDVHGPSLVVDPRSFRWSDQEWQRPAFRDLVIYELHIGTFTPGGTFRSAIEKLPALRELGVNAIEIMPIGDFPGGRNWGYDGVLIYAPAHAYGSPDDLRALVDAAHQQGLAVILDVVYNHLGPDGNYLPTFSAQFFNEKHHTPWGRAFNFDGESSAPVREFFGKNPVYWMEEFHIDGFRMDATHEIADDSERHILAEMSEAIHARGGYAMAEDERNEARMLQPVAENGRGFDGVWADDFHHTTRVAVTSDRQSYFENFEGTLTELVDTLQHGWLFRGQKPRVDGSLRGTECADLSPSHFVHCISNHDQTGNRAFGERLSHAISPEAYRTLSALLCLTPYTPMLFMGQEWGASTPFLYFTEHNETLGPLVTEGRRKEFAGFAEFGSGASLTSIPDPQEEKTFQNSKLDWAERNAGVHGAILALYSECLRLRKSIRSFRPNGRDSWKVAATSWGAGALRFDSAEGEFLILFDLHGGHRGSFDSEFLTPPSGTAWELLLSSEEERFGGGKTGFDFDQQSVDFKHPETLILSTKPLR
jgi:maltooligosyltrehalose trehalohydrolase